MLQLFQNAWFSFSTPTQPQTLSPSNGSKHRQRFTGEAIVSQEIRLDQKGRVCFRGSWWPASCEQDIILEPGVIVEVIGIRDITLLVKPRTYQFHSK